MAIVEDPSLFLADFGVPVVAGAVSGLGILDMPGEVVLDNMVISTDYSLRVEASKFGALGYGSAVTVDGKAYTVRESKLLDDGAFLLLSLERAAGDAQVTAVILDGDFL